jgi:iron-sulfur cluster assembly protein
LTIQWYASIFRKRLEVIGGCLTKISWEGAWMITLTPLAIDKIKAFIAERQEGAGLRISVTGGGCSGFQYQMYLEQNANADDKVIEQGGLKVFVDSRSYLYLAGTQIDYVDDVNGSGFKFDNPNAGGTCGCGESFNA